MNAATFTPPDQRFVWQRSQLAPDIGDCYSDSLLVEPGLSLVYSHYLPTRHLLERSQIERKVRGLTFTVALEGRSSVQTEGGDRIEFLAGHNTVTTMKSGRGERRFLANEKVRQLRLIADESVLQNYGLIDLLQQDSGLGPSYRILFVKQGAGTRSAAERLVQLHSQGGSPIDLQIATLTLLSEHARTLKSCDVPQKQGSLSNADQDRINRARDLIMTHYTKALTVAYVCSTVGINEFKLKQGFRDYFGTSPHRLLVECRMQKAWQLLEAGARVSSTAYQVGYQHVSSFSKAFQLFFGRAPKSVSARG